MLPRDESCGCAVPRAFRPDTRVGRGRLWIGIRLWTSLLSGALPGRYESRSSLAAAPDRRVQASSEPLRLFAFWTTTSGRTSGRKSRPGAMPHNPRHRVPQPATSWRSKPFPRSNRPGSSGRGWVSQAISSTYPESTAARILSASSSLRFWRHARVTPMQTRQVGAGRSSTAPSGDDSSGRGKVTIALAAAPAAAAAVAYVISSDRR